jgi:hypothetical protein
MVAQLKRLRLRVLSEGLPRPDADRNNRQHQNRRRDPPASGPDTRAVRATSMRDEVDHPTMTCQSYGDCR